MTCISQEDIKVSEISQPQKDEYCMIPFNDSIKIVKLIEAENIIVVARDQVRGKWGAVK